MHPHDELHESNEPFLFWEKVATARWGQYLSNVEESHILFGAKLREPDIALDVGAEGGRWSALLSEMGWQTICTDVDAGALAVCEQRIPDATCVCVDPNSQDLPCGTNTVQLLLCIEVDEVLECDWFVREASRVLDDEGVLVGVFQNLISWRGFAKRFMPLRDDGIIDYKVSYAAWRKKMQQEGFKFVREEGLCWFPFSRRSDSAMIPFCVKLEERVGLRRWPTISPWIVFVAKRDRTFRAQKSKGSP